MMKKRILSLTAALCLLLALLPAQALAAESVNYLACDEKGRNWETRACADYTQVTAGGTAWSDGWYVVNGEVTISGRVTVTGAVHLILADGCSLNAKQGIQVKDSDSLTIYAQSQGDGMGKLTANGPGCCAGIGGGDHQSGGAITICGGEVTATAPASTGDPAGIGGGGYGEGGTVVIHGGVVSANGSQKGIGCGAYATKGSITINGGRVTANGIGTGDYGARVDTKINGGLVVCTDTSCGGINAGNEITWVGIIFKETDSGQVYGSCTLTEDLEIPWWTTLTVPAGAALEVADGVTLVNNGRIVNDGAIENRGTIENCGTVSGNAPQDEGSGRTDSTPAISVTFQNDQGEAITSQEYGKSITVTATARQKTQANVALLANGLADGRANFYLDNGGEPILLNEQPLEVTDSGSGVITAVLTLALDSADWKIGGNTVRVDFGPYGALHLLDGSGSAGLTVTPQVVNDFPEGGFCLNDGSISVEKRDEDTIFVAQGTTGYPIAKDVPVRVTGKTEMTANTIIVRGADVDLVLEDVNQGGGEWPPYAVSIEPVYDQDAERPANVTLTLEGSNTLAASGWCEQGIAVGRNCTLTIEGPGALKIGNENTYVGIGIGERYDFGHVVINGGTVDVTAQIVAIGSEMMHGGEDAPSITINGGVVKTNVQDGYGVGIGTRHAMEGGVDIAIHGGSLELSGEGNRISASENWHDPPDESAPGSVTITGGSIAGVSAEDGIFPAPVNENGASLVPVTVGTGKSGADVGDLMLTNTEYGSPSKTDADGNLTLYLPVGEYTGLAIIGGELQTITATAAQETPGTGVSADTGIQVELPEGTKPDIQPDGSILFPGGSEIVQDSTVITVPPGGRRSEA